MKKYLIVFLISMVPLIELRGAIPYAVGFGLPLKACGEVGSIIAAKVVEVVGTKIDIPRWRVAKQEIRELTASYGR